MLTYVSKEGGSMLGDRIQARMEKLGMSQADVARRAGLSSGHVSDLVTGQKGKRVSAETVEKLARALKVSPTFFYRVDSRTKVSKGRR